VEPTYLTAGLAGVAALFTFGGLLVRSLLKMEAARDVWYKERKAEWDAEREEWHRTERELRLRNRGPQ